MAAGGSGREGGRSLKTRVRTARKRSLSSTLWLERQLNDPFVALAKREGWRSRAAYKLLEIAEKHRLFRPGARIVDLGAAPGGWSQVAARAVKSGEGEGRVIGIDLMEMEPIDGVEFKAMDFHDPAAPDALRDWLGGRADGVMSDMAANATGHRATDHLRIVGLAELAADFAASVLAPGDSSSPRCCRAARRANCWRGSSATIRSSAISSRRPAAPTAPSSTCWRRGSAERRASGQNLALGARIIGPLRAGGRPGARGNGGRIAQPRAIRSRDIDGPLGRS